MSSVCIYDSIARVFWDAYDDIKAARHAEYWFKGGRGSTKSSFISIAIIRGLLANPDANALIYRRVGNTVKDSVFSQMLWAIDRLELTPWFKCKVSPFEIIYKPTDQRIMFRGADDPMKSKSIKLQHGYFEYLWFEELAEFQGMDAVRTIKQSALRGVDRAYTFYSYNPPKSAQNWVNAEALKVRSDRLVHHSTYLDVPPEWLKDAFIAEAEALRETNERAYRNEYLGEVTGMGGSVFENLNLRSIPDDEISTFGQTYAGMDFGWFPDPLHFVRCAYDPARRRLHVYDEFRTVKTPNYDVYQYLTEHKRLTGWEEVIADSQEQKSIHDFRAYGMNCIGATKGPGSVSASIRWLQSLSEIIIDPVRCPDTAKEFMQYEYERTRDGEFVAAYPDANNHAIDAVRYATKRSLPAGGCTVSDGVGRPSLEPREQGRHLGIHRHFRCGRHRRRQADRQERRSGHHHHDLHDQPQPA